MRVASAGNTNARSHGHTSKSGPPSPTYRSWMMMLSRCRDMSNPDYGGAGVRVCSRWERFESFLEDMGERPLGTSIDRVDNALGYTKDNCRWATAATQNRNRSITKLNEVSVALIRHMKRRGSKAKDLAHAFGVSRMTVSRAANGESWS